MSYAAFAEPHELPAAIRRSDLESDRFGLSIGRLDVSAPAAAEPGALETVAALSAASDLDVVVVRYPAASAGWFAALGAVGRDAIAADALLYWRSPPLAEMPDGDVAPGAGAVSLRRARPSEADAVDGLVRTMFADYGSHYAANPLFDPVAAAEGYVEWARTYVTADAASGRRAYLLVEEGADGSGPPSAADSAGLATLDLGSHPEAVLAGIAPAARNRGWYRVLIALAAREVRAAGGEALHLSTQVQNIAVQRAWAALGFRPVLALQTVHLVRPGLLPVAAEFEPVFQRA